LFYRLDPYSGSAAVRGIIEGESPKNKGVFSLEPGYQFRTSC
jgi:hypothetical protein